MKIFKLLFLISLCFISYGFNSNLFAQDNPVTVDTIPPAVPILISPPNNATLYTATLTLIWHRAVDADTYHLVMEPREVNYYLAETTFTLALCTGGYYWKVRAKDTAGNWSNFSPTWTFIVFNPGWVQKESMPTQIARKYVSDGGAMVTVPDVIDNDLIFVFRGNRSWEFYGYVFGVPGCWILLESIPYGVYPNNPTQINRKKVDEGAALCYDGANTIYAIKGNGTTEFWKYEIMIDSWIARPFVPSERGLRGGTSLAYYNDKVFLLAGEQSEYASTNFFAYNTSTDVWTSLAPAPLIPDGRTFRDGSCIVQLNGIIYAIKGGGKHNYFWAYEVATNTWTLMDTIPLIHPCNQTGDDSDDEIEINDLKGSTDRMRKTKVKSGGAMTAGAGEIYAIKGGGAQDFGNFQMFLVGRL